MGRRTTLAIGVLAVLNGLFFASNIYVLGNREAALRMHEDLAPTASALLANLKVIVCFVTGVLYVGAGVGLLCRRPAWCLGGAAGSVLFLAFYAVEIVLWAGTHPVTLLGFCIFGGLALLIGGGSLRAWRDFQAAR